MTTVEFKRQFEAIQQQFRASLPARLSEIEQDLHAASANNLQALAALYANSHKLSGAGSTFGLPALSELACELEHLAASIREGTTLPDAQVWSRALGLLENMKALTIPPSVMAEALEPQPPEPAERDVPHLVLFEEDRLEAEHLVGGLAAFGFQAVVASDLSSLTAALSEGRPQALLADVSIPKDPLGGPRVLLQADLPKDLPILFLSVRDDLEARLWASRAGGQAYLTKPVAMEELVDTIENLLKRNEAPDPLRFLVVEDDPLQAEQTALYLKVAGHECRTHSGAQGLLEALSGFKPDLLVLDLYLEKFSGHELTITLRQMPQFQELPIVILSMESDRPIQSRTLQSGADDFVNKPFDPLYFISSLAARARRARLLSQFRTTDGLTGLPNHTHLVSSLETELAIQARKEGRCCYAMIDVDHFKHTNDTHGHLVGDRVLRSLGSLLRNRLRRGDIVGRYGGEEFGLILPDTDLAAASAVLNGLRESFQSLLFQGISGPFSCTFSAGIAQWTPNTTLQELVQSADQCLYAAKAKGRNAVVTGPCPTAAPR